MNKSIVLWVSFWSIVLLGCTDVNREDPTSLNDNTTFTDTRDGHVYKQISIGA